MTIKFDQIPASVDSTASYVGHRPLLRHEIDLLAIINHRVASGRSVARIAAQAFVSAARMELREGHIGTYENGHRQIPAVKGLVLSLTPDEWGATFFVDLEYSSRGHRATYGGKYDPTTRRFNWTCYMD